MSKNQGKDSFERINYLYQAAHLLSTQNPTISAYYGQLCKTIAKKHVLRMEPNFKRTICKRCAIILIPGKTASIQLDQHDKIVCINCIQCKCTKRFHINKN